MTQEKWKKREKEEKKNESIYEHGSKGEEVVRWRWRWVQRFKLKRLNGYEP